MSKWYGSLTNRLEEDRMFCDDIKVGTGMTEYSWSDTEAYEVVAVRDQKHVTVRVYDHKKKDGAEWCDNDWELISNPNNPEKDMVKVGNYWYWTLTITADDLEKMVADDDCALLRLAVGGWDAGKIRAKGKQTKRWRAKVSFGVARYHYDYSF